MKNSQLARKVYEALAEKCEEEFSLSRYDHWCEYLKENNIRPRDYDEAADAADDLMDLANDGTDQVICDDPFSGVVDHIGGFQFLMVPKELAEKIAVLKALP